MWVTLSTAIAEERPRGASVAALSYDYFGKSTANVAVVVFYM